MQLRENEDQIRTLPYEFDICYGDWELDVMLYRVSKTLTGYNN